MREWLSVVAAAGALACAPISSRGMHMTDGHTQRSLEDEALRALLSDAYVTPVQPADVIIDHPPGEIFRADGIHLRIVSRTRIEGRFEIRQGAVCVWGPNFERRCRRVVFNRNGTYTFTDIASGSSQTLVVTPLD